MMLTHIIRPKRRKIFYVPGMLSLLFVPFVFINYGKTEPKNPAGFRIYIADKNYLQKYPGLNALDSGHFPPRRNYANIVFTGNNKNDQTKLDFAQIRIREILSENNSTDGVRFGFTDSCEYWTFVKAAGVLIKEGAGTFAPLDDDIWFYHIPPDTTTKYWICGTVGIENITEEPKISWWLKTSNLLEKVWQGSWQIVIAFIVFVVMTIIFRQQQFFRKEE